MLIPVSRVSGVLLIVALACAAQTSGQPEAVSPSGVKFFSQPDEKGVVVEAERNSLLIQKTSS